MWCNIVEVEFVVVLKGAQKRSEERRSEVRLVDELLYIGTGRRRIEIK